MLGLPGLEGLRLAAGNEGIGREISDVNMMDNPDTFDWLLPGELVLTTGYIFRDDADYQHRLIGELVRRGCSGFGMKIQRFFAEIPAVILNEGNRLGFPVVEIPYRYSLAEVSRLVSTEIFGHGDVNLRRALQAHDQWMQLLIDGGSPRDIAEQLTGSLRRAAFVLDSAGRLIYAAGLRQLPSSQARWLKPAYQETIFGDRFVDQIPQGVGMFRKSIQIELPDQMVPGGMVCQVVPAISARQVYGYIVVPHGDEPLTALDHAALGQAATLIALDRIRAQQVEAAEHRRRGDFFADLVGGRIHSVHGLRQQAVRFGLTPLKQYSCLVIDGTDQMPDAWEVAALAADGREAVFFVAEGRPAALLPVADDEPPRFTRRRLLELANAMAGKIRADNPSVNPVIGIGNAARLLTINRSYHEAVRAIDMHKALAEDRPSIHYRDLLVYRVLDRKAEEADIDAFLEAVLGPLLEHDRLRKTSLIDTLRVYYRHGGRPGATAEALFVHRNTLQYRMRKIRDLLQSDPDRAEESLEIQLAIKLLDVRRLSEKWSK